MVLVAPRSAKLVATYGSRFTLLSGYVFLFLAFLGMLLLWNEDTPYWQIAIPYVFIGHRRRTGGNSGLELAHRIGAREARRHGLRHGRSSARSRRRAHDSRSLGAVLTSRYASAWRTSRCRARTSSATEAQLQLSFASAENIAAATSPQYSDAIIAGAKSSFLDGDQWAYAAGLVAVLLGAVLVFFMFPKHEREDALRASYHAQDTAVAER